MVNLLLIIAAFLVVTVGRTDGTVTLPIATLTKRQGRPVTFSCQVSGGEMFVGWRTPAKAARPGVAAIPSVNIPASQTTGRRRIATSRDTYALTIDKLTVEDGGEYICQGSSNSAVFTLYIDYELGDVVKAQTLTLGQKGTIVLDVPAYPPLNYTWKKDGKELTFPTQGKTLDPYTGSITITIVQVSDEGSYTCEVIFNKAPSGESVAIEVEVVDKPQILKYQGDPVKRRLTEGNNVTFHCDVKSGRPTPVVTWYFGWVNKTKKVDTQFDERYSHPTNETWTITGIQKQDQGQYRCITENSAGEDDLRFEITAVDSPPGRPIIYSPSSTLLTNETFTLMWRAPEEIGGDGNITYTVRYRVEKDKNSYGPWKTITTKNLQVEITGLDNKVTYKFEVTAKNKWGVSGPAGKYIQTNFPGEPVSSSQTRLVSSAFLTISVGGIFLLLAFDIMNAYN